MEKIFRLLFFLTATLLYVTGCAKDNYTLIKSEVPPLEEVSYKNVKYEYKIQPHDRISLRSYQILEADSQFSTINSTEANERGLLVDANGNINLPLINTVHIAGLTQTQASKLIERKYKKYIKKPSFNVEVLNKRAYVLGEVRKPGPIGLDKEKMTILEAIAFAGDLTDDAIRDNIIVISKAGKTNMKVRKIDLTKLDTIAYSNISIKPNDIIYVQPNKWKRLKVSSSNMNEILRVVNLVASPFLMMRSINNIPNYDYSGLK